MIYKIVPKNPVCTILFFHTYRLYIFKGRIERATMDYVKHISMGRRISTITRFYYDKQ